MAGHAGFDDRVRSAQEAARHAGATSKEVGRLTPSFAQPVVIHTSSQPIHLVFDGKVLAEANVRLARRHGGYVWESA